MKKHWRMLGVSVVGAALALTGAVLVFLWFVGMAQSSGLVPMTLGFWTMANLVTFILYSIFWELLLVGIPIVIAVVVGWQLWWKRLPMDERRFRFGGRKRSTGGGGGGLFFFILFCIKVFVDGKWNVPISTFTLDYVAGSVILILVLVVIVFGIAGAVGLTWWLSREMKKP